MKSAHSYGFVAIISVLALLWSTFDILSSPTPFNGGVEAVGQVAYIMPNAGGVGLGNLVSTETWTVVFETANKQNVTFYDSWNFWGSGNQGENVSVYYDSRDPQKAMTMDSFATRIILFAVLLVCSIFLSYKWNKERGRKFKLHLFLG